jgi:hypothetical protein
VKKIISQLGQESAQAQLIDRCLILARPPTPFLKQSVVATLHQIAQMTRDYLSNGSLPFVGSRTDHQDPAYMFERMFICFYPYLFPDLDDIHLLGHQECMEIIYAHLQIKKDDMVSSQFGYFLLTLATKFDREADKLAEGPPCGAYAPLMS